MNKYLKMIPIFEIAIGIMLVVNHDLTDIGIILIVEGFTRTIYRAIKDD